MASSKSYRDFVIDQLSDLNPMYKSMMGEYLIYVNGIYFGGIFDDRFLIKITKTNIIYQKNCLIIMRGLYIWLKMLMIRIILKIWC